MRCEDVYAEHAAVYFTPPVRVRGRLARHAATEVLHANATDVAGVVAGELVVTGEVRLGAVGVDPDVALNDSS